MLQGGGEIEVHEAFRWWHGDRRASAGVTAEKGVDAGPEACTSGRRCLEIAPPPTGVPGIR
jgi:hypothetical protein